MIILTEKPIEIAEREISFEEFKSYMMGALEIEKITPGDDGRNLTDVEFIIRGKDGRYMMLNIGSYGTNGNSDGAALCITVCDVTDYNNLI